MTLLSRRDFSTLQDRMNRIFRESYSTESPDQALTRLVTLTDPRPVARSYPEAAKCASVLPPVFVVITPTPEPVLLQSVLPPVQATEIFPFVMSMKTQEAGGGDAGFVKVLELQFE